jgi:hypothetical protein
LTRGDGLVHRGLAVVPPELVGALQQRRHVVAQRLLLARIDLERPDDHDFLHTILPSYGGMRI